MSFHFYADGTQLYISFKSSILGDLSRACSTLEACGHDIDMEGITWLRGDTKFLFEF